MVLHVISLHCMVLHGIVLYSGFLHGIALSCIVVTAPANYRVVHLVIFVVAVNGILIVSILLDTSEPRIIHLICIRTSRLAL